MSDPRHAEARALRESRASYGEIAAEMGVSTSTVYRWLNPDYAEQGRAVSRRVKESYRGSCIDCGAPTSWTGRVAHESSERCHRCRKAFEHDQAVERCLSALREWHTRYGEVPSAADWLFPAPSCVKRMSPARRAILSRRHAEYEWPPMSSVQAVFGSWNAGLEAAGLPAVTRGKRRAVAA